MALTTYFGKIGTDNEETFAYMGRAKSLSTDSVKGEAACDTLTIPLMLCLKETAALTEKASRSDHYLAGMVTFQQLEQFERLSDRTNSAFLERKVLKAQNASLPQKMPSLKVPRFDDDAIKGVFS